MSGRTLLLLILFVALLVRVAAALAVQHRLDTTLHRPFLIAGDAEGYWHLAHDLAAGRDYAVYEPPRYVLRMPGFPLLLAAVLRTADLAGLPHQPFLCVRLVLAGVGTLACWLTYRLGRELFNESAGLIAAASTAISPTLVGFSVLVLSETLFAATLLLSLLAAARLVRVPFDPAHRKQGLLWAALAGIAVALAVYVRPSWLLAGPLLATGLVLAARGRRFEGLLRGGVLVAVLLAALVPWAARNQAVTGHWIWTTLWVGPSLYDGLNPQATGDSEMSFFERDRVNQQLSEYEVDQHYRREARQFVRENPGRTLVLAGLKLARYWSPVPNAAQFSAWWMQGAVALFFVPLVALAVGGVWRFRSHLWLLAFTAGPILYFAAIHSIFVGSIRYRLPAEYPLAVLAAATLVTWMTPRGNASRRDHG